MQKQVWSKCTAASHHLQPHDFHNFQLSWCFQVSSQKVESLWVLAPPFVLSQLLRAAWYIIMICWNSGNCEAGCLVVCCFCIVLSHRCTQFAKYVNLSIPKFKIFLYFKGLPKIRLFLLIFRVICCILVWWCRATSQAESSLTIEPVLFLFAAW